MNKEEYKKDIECPTVGTLYTMQIAFQNLLGRSGIPKDDVSLLQESLLGLIGEVGEVLQADQRWKKNGRNVKYDRGNKVEEIADCFIYLLNACIYSDISVEDFMNSVYNKINTNTVRYLTHYRPILEYKGFHARIRWNKTDSQYYGQILGIEDTVCFTSSTLQGVIDNFHKSVNNYLYWCSKD